MRVQQVPKVQIAHPALLDEFLEKEGGFRPEFFIKTLILICLSQLISVLVCGQGMVIIILFEGGLSCTENRFC
jgi:hypothetical protein